MTMSSPTFDEATRVTALDANAYAGFFPAQYCIGSVPHGGFVASCILSVVQAHLASRGQPDTVIAHVEYLNRTEIGRAVFLVEEVKTGRRTSVVHVTLYQHATLDHAPWITPGRSRREVVAYLTNTSLAHETGLTLPTEFALHPAPPPKPDLAKLKADHDDGYWKLLRLPRDGYRAVMERCHYYVPHTGHEYKATLDLWISLATGEHFTNALLGYVADCWPYVVESFRPPSREKSDGAPFAHDDVFWYPTLVLNLDVKKALPPGGVEWLHVRVASKRIQNGRLDIEVIIFDAQGDLVALSQHVCLILSAERNLAKRSHTKSNI